MGCLFAKSKVSESQQPPAQPVKEKLPTIDTTSFAGKYSKGKQLGKGGFSVVFEVTDKATGVRYAAKEMKKENMKSDDIASLKQEIDILSSLKHERIVRFIDYFEESDKYYVVLELLEGGELFDRIVKKTTYSEKEARDLVYILFKALKYCHDNNIAHRDLKPENLLLVNDQDDDNVKVADFGFAKRCKGNSLSTQCGSPGYIAPEILKAEKYGLPSDMWSLGVITYILLGGYPPFHDDRDQAGLFRKIKKGVFKFHPQYWDHISMDAKDLISGLLTVDTERRLTIDQALAHPWLDRTRQLDSQLSMRNLNVNLDNFKKFHATRKFRSAVKVVIAMNRMRSNTASGKDEAVDDDTDWVTGRQSDVRAPAEVN